MNDETKENSLDPPGSEAGALSGRPGAALGNPTPTASPSALSRPTLEALLCEQASQLGSTWLQRWVKEHICSPPKDTAASDGTSLYASYSPAMDAPQTNGMAITEVFSSKPTQGHTRGSIKAPRPVSERIMPCPGEIGYV